MESKQCKICGTIKPLTEFYRQGTQSQYYMSYCKHCLKTKYYNKEYRFKYNKKRKKARQEKYSLSNLDIIKGDRCYTDSFHKSRVGGTLTKEIAMRDITKECGENKFYSKNYIPIEFLVLQNLQCKIEVQYI